MELKDILAEFDEETRTGRESPEWKALFDELCQEAIRLGMEMNHRYHTPEELRELMGRLTGRPIDDTFRLFPPFYTDFGKNIVIGKEVFINSGCHFQDQGGIRIGDGALIGHNVVLATINHDLDPGRTGRTIMRPLRSGSTCGSVRILSGLIRKKWRRRR